MTYDTLLSELSGALSRGDVAPADIEKLLRRRRAASERPDVPSVLRAAGALVCFAGAALLYGIGFHSYPVLAQEMTPFLFPAVALGAAVLLHRRRRARSGRWSWRAWSATSRSAKAGRSA